MKKRRLSFQTIFAKEHVHEQLPPTTPPDLPSPGSRNYKTLPRSFGAQMAYYDAPSLDGLVLADTNDSFLLDDDPFADLSGGPRQLVDAPKDPTPPPPVPPIPPLPPSPISKHPPSPVRTVSAQATPAYQRPAFKARPSLPSLSSLAKMNVPTPKVRRGRVGAGLPAEPWDLDPDALPVVSPTHATTPISPQVIPANPCEFEAPQSPVLPPTTPTSPTTFLDFSSDSDEGDHPQEVETRQLSSELAVKPSPAITRTPPVAETTLATPPVIATSSPTLASPQPQPIVLPRSSSLEAHPPAVVPESLSPRSATYPPLSPHSSSLAVKPLPVLREIPSPEPPPVPPKDHDVNPLSDSHPSELAVQALASRLDDFPLDDGPLELGEDFGHQLGLDLGLGLDFGHSPRGGEEVEPALGRNHSKRLSAQDGRSRASSTSRSRAGSLAVSRRASRTALVETEILLLDTVANHSPSNSASRSRARSRATSSASSSNSTSSRGIDEKAAKRRTFRKSSLVGDVLKFAPASPERPSVLDKEPVAISPEDNFRSSVLSTANDAGHEELDDELGTAQKGCSSPERIEGFSSPLSARSPERQYSSPYSTPSITTDARSPDSSWSGHEHAEFDFDWLSDHRRTERFPTSSSNSSDYGEELEEERGRWRQAPVLPPPSVYSDEELAMADTDNSGRLAPGFVFPARAHLAENSNIQPGTSADTIRARSGITIPRGDSLWNSDDAPTLSNPSSTSDSEDDFGTSSAEPFDDGASDDDIPLARRIPTALSAQQSIRRQVKEERMFARELQGVDGSEPRSRQTTLRPFAAPMPPPFTSIVEPHERLRTLTLPGSGIRSLAVDSLTEKLQNMRASHNNKNGVMDPSWLTFPTASRRLSTSASPPPNRNQPLPETRGLRAMRSFQRPKTADVSRTAPLDYPVRVRRSNTTLPERDPSNLVVPAFERNMLPPIPSPSSTSPSRPLPPSPSENNLMRIFVGDAQHFTLVDIGPSTTASDALSMVEEQGSLKGWVGTGDWIMFEVAQSFGMERPIRGFELLADVQASWNKDKMINMLVVKLTPLAHILNHPHMPLNSPTFSGYVEWEYKRGKWKHRFLRIRHHALWLSKRENDKEEVYFCSLSTFDAYTLTRPHKAPPKPFTFAVKSTQNSSTFENPADYLHIFSCNSDEGEQWLEKIRLARSFVLCHNVPTTNPSIMRKSSAPLLSENYSDIVAPSLMLRA
ncbi:hypothetical protein MIND_00342200 [Mycena indigotica]|uniref:PH domain-containing protein n=1 Tax=Mycena indigotica TaxID=2126181 RepID=A0A8H6T2K2_9AGAR|nr:uncharacterized protein MIND_00342200 [Mycena indigotica]KAF7309705.1 hypothetical protein MIND_00342200 [Mycena indigotica]